MDKSKFFTSVEGAWVGVMDSTIFFFVAVGLGLIFMWIITRPMIQELVIPNYNELKRICKKYMDKGFITQEEALLALACAVNGGLRICGFLFFIALLSTFL